MSGAGNALSIVIPTYQRRDQLLRLVRSLEPELQALPDCELVVVIDGSTDGSAEAVEALPYPVDVRVVRQPNRGLAAARNAGARAASHPIVLFLDDDLDATPGLIGAHLAAHRAAHLAAGSDVAVMGRYPMPPDADVEASVIAGFDRSSNMLVGHTEVTDRSLFLAGNLSLPVAVLEQVGAFDEHFVGWGPEDYDFGCRLLDAGFRIVYEPAALAWHRQDKPPAALVRDAFQSGRNGVVASAKGMTDERSAIDLSTTAARLWRLGVHGQRSWQRLSDVALALYRVRLRPRRTTRNPFLRLAMSTARVAGCLSVDGGARAVSDRADQLAR